MDFEVETNKRVDRYKIEAAQNWMGWIKKIPPIEFPPGWKIQVIPPFGGALVRFRVWIPGMDANDFVSVYLDVDNSLGYYGPLDKLEPYWEVYPVQGDASRCDLEDIPELLKMISDRSDKT